MIRIADIGNVQIFTTGAHLRPMKVKDASGSDFWIWAVEKFEDDSFKDGNVYNPIESASSLENLLKEMP